MVADSESLGKQGQARGWCSGVLKAHALLLVSYGYQDACLAWHVHGLWLCCCAI